MQTKEKLNTECVSGNINDDLKIKNKINFKDVVEDNGYGFLQEKGITLIVLVITSVLLILIGVTIAIIVKDNRSLKREKSESELGFNNENVTESQEEKEFKKVGEIYDATGKEEEKLHIGDFVNYEAGTWTEEEISSIKVGANTSLVSANNSTSNPSNPYQFGGFLTGSSRNENATPCDSTYNYAKDKSTGDAVKGWRVFDVSDEMITLISAGCPENYYHANGTNYAYISEYILTGNINSDATSLNLDKNYTKRNWDNYINEIQGATGATVLTKKQLDDWYTKYQKEANSNTWSNSTFQKIYGTSYESLIDNYSRYWFSSAASGSRMYFINPYNRVVGSYDNNAAMGLRILVFLKSDIELSEKRVGTKTITTRGEDYIYNVWDIKE